MSISSLLSASYIYIILLVGKKGRLQSKEKLDVHLGRENYDGGLLWVQGYPELHDEF